MNNRWNELIYKCWAPIYDTFFNSRKFSVARDLVFREEQFIENQKILFVGVGTGADLELVNHRDLDITAIDYSNEMLDKAKAKFKNTSIQFIKMDAQEMNFENNQFDTVVGSLILSVVPDPAKSMNEMIRVLKPNGRIIIFDKFSPGGEELSPIKKVIRPLIKLLGTDIGINFEALYEENKSVLSLEEDTAIMFNGMYRKIVMRKKSD